MKYAHITVEPMNPNIGATISGVDLNNVTNPAVYEEIKQALWKHGVIFFRKQPLEPESYLKLGRAFGEPEKHEFFPHPEGYPQIQKISHQGFDAPDTDRWHHDVSFRDNPSLISILRAVDIPASGGDTMWMNCNLAFESLHPAMQTLLLDLEVIHDLPALFRRMGQFEKMAKAKGISREEFEMQMMKNNPEKIHPAIVNHPITKKLTLYVNSAWSRDFVGMHRDLSDAFMQMLWEWVKKPEFMCRFTWENDSIAIWDNLATQHYAVFDYAPHYREMQRMTTAEFTPVLDRSTVAAEVRPASWQSSPAAQKALDSIVDQSRLANASPKERAAVDAIFDALKSTDLNALARNS